MADSSTYTIRIAGGVDAAVLGSIDALKNRILGTDGVLASMSSRFTGLIAGVLGGGALLRLGMDAIKSADDLGKFSQEVGIGVENLSKLKYAADLSDVGEQFRQGMLKFSGSIAESVDQGSKASQIFTAMGVATTDLTGKLRPTDQILFDVADKFATYSDGANKAALAQELFGTKNVRFIAMLSDGSRGLREMGDELERIGGVVTPKASEQAQVFNDSLTRLKVQFGGIALEVGTKILPSITSLIEAFTNVGAAGTQIAPVFTVITEGIKYLSIGVVEATGLLKIFGIMLGQMPVAAWEAMKGNIIGASAVWKQMKADLDAAQQERYAKIDELRNPIPALVHSFTAPPPRGEAPNPFAQSDAVKDYIRDLRDALDLEQRSLDLMRVRAQVDFTKTDAEKRDAELSILAREAGLLDEHISKLKQRRDLLTDPKARDEFDNAIRSAEQRRSGVEVRRAGIEAQADPRSVSQQMMASMTQLRNQFGTVAQNIAHGFTDVIGNAVQSVSNGITSLIMGTKSWAQALNEIGVSILTNIVQAIVQMAVRWIATQIMMAAAGKAIQASLVAASVPIAVAESAVWATPATLATIASYGTAAATAPAFIAAANATTMAMSLGSMGGFAEGGFTGMMDPDQVAGVVHGREYVFDADSTSRIGVANLERIRQGSYAPTAGSGSSSGQSGRGQSQPVNVKIAAINGRQDMRDFMASEGHKIVWDQSAKRGNKFKT